MTMLCPTRAPSNFANANPSLRSCCHFEACLPQLSEGNTSRGQVPSSCDDEAAMGTPTVLIEDG